MSDTISNALTKIKNANHIKHEMVRIPITEMSKNIIEILKDEGYICHFQQEKMNQIFFNIILKYVGPQRIPGILGIKRISRPGLRKYFDSKNLSLNNLGHLGIAIITTSQGLMTNIKAHKLGIGGEILFYVW